MRNGTRMMVELTEREPKKIELFPNDYLEVGARVYNDYSRSRGLSVQGYGNRLVCENGVVAPRNIGRRMQIFAYGTAEFSKEIEDQIEACLNDWAVMSDWIKESKEKEVSVKDVILQHSFLSKKYMEEIVKILPDRV